MLDQPQFGLVLELVNPDGDAAIKLQSGYSFTTEIGNLIPVTSGEANKMDSQGSSRSGASRVGKPFTHFISASITGDGDLAQIRKYQETLESIPEIGKPKKTQKMHVTLACLCVSESEVEETEQKFQRVGDRFTDTMGTGSFLNNCKGLELGDGGSDTIFIMVLLENYSRFYL